MMPNASTDLAKLGKCELRERRGREKTYLVQMVALQTEDNS